MTNLPVPVPIEPNTPLDLRRGWATIERSAWIIVASVGLAVAAGVIAARRVEPTYQAEVTVRIDEQRPSTLGAQYYFGPDYQQLLATSTEIITSRNLALEVVDSLGLRLGVVQPQRTPRSVLVRYAVVDATAPDAEYRFTRAPGGFEVRSGTNDAVLGVFPDTSEIVLPGVRLQLTQAARETDRMRFALASRLSVANALRGQLEVLQTNRNANVLRVTFRGPDPELTRDIPNVVAHRFVRRKMDLERVSARSTVTYLETQLESLNSQLFDAEAEIRDYLLDQGITTPTDQAAYFFSEINNLKDGAASLRGIREQLTGALAGAEGMDSLTRGRARLERILATHAFSDARIAESEVGRLELLVDQRNALLQRRMPSDPDVRALDNRIDAVQDVIEERARKFLGSVNAQIAVLENRIASLDEARRRIPEQQLTFDRLERNRRVLEDLSMMVQSRLKEAEITAAVQDSTAQVLDEAAGAPMNISQSKSIIFFIAVLTGLVVGVSIAFLREWLDTTIRTEADLASIVGVAVVGIIPNLQQQARSGAYRLGPPSAVGAAAGKHPTPVPGRDPHTPAAEAYRSLRTNLNYLTPPKPPRVIVLTSALPGDGKTTTTVNLAVTLAHQGQRVILIDAETRRGTVHDVFGIPPAPGFLDLMYGQATPGECIRRVAMEGGGTIDVLPLGSAPTSNPADLLVSQRLQPLFERLRQQYDYVLLDTPPLNLFTDAALIGAQADALLLVARADRTDREELRFAVAQLRNVQVNLAGAVLNDVEFRRSSRYRLGQSYYYDYGR
ncbi:MAG: polysaccharide biosynthesis tyrosine autokinase [Gemmatimonadota bacterium]|nr:polysaccharide biosynthesis tyrosine autokinase [Gemmatimonadota bacterium]